MRNIYKAVLVAMVIGLLVVRPASSYADWNGHGGNSQGHFSGQGHDHGHGYYGGYGRSYIGVNLSLWPDTGYYGAPYYSPATGVLVAADSYQPVEVDQQPQTVVQPQTVDVNQAVAPAPVITAAGTASDASDSITINIPNNKGGYTAVTLTKSGNGFIGPQGEFYTDFPKVSQLILIYGK